MNLPKILIVEDDHDTRVAYRNSLEEHGYEVVTTTNGKSALEALKKGTSIGLILLDLNMPIMSGNEFLKIKNASPDIAQIPVLVVTVHQDKLTHPVSGVLQKPVALAGLLDAVKLYFKV